MLGTIALLSGGAASGADLKLQAEPAFAGYGAANGTFPLAVSLANSGPDARGSLHVSCGDFQMEYPVELPHGSLKRLVTYPILEYGSEVDLDLSTNQGGILGRFHALFGQDPTAQSVLMIGDTQGDLEFLRPQTTSPTSKMWDCYVKPGDAPDRPVAYSGISAVVLASGSERLGDSVVRALHVYLAGGGTIAFLGGASSPVLSDRRWVDVAPVVPKLPKSVAGSQLVTNISTRNNLDDVAGPITITDAEAVPGAIVRRENGRIILARKDVGLGKTVFIAFNPIEPPFTRWAGRRALFQKVLRTDDFAKAKGYLAQFTAASNFNDDDPYSSTGGMPPPGIYSGSMYPSRPADPFSTKLPAPAKVLWILCSYFVVIIPINFLLLKKLKRGELAWVTAPLISVGFAGAFFAAASDLYSAKLSTATQGLIVATSGSPDALFVGRSQLFFPQGGEFDLRMNDVESVFAPTQGDEYYGYGYRSRDDQQSLQDVNPIDVGHVLVSRMDVGNLSFREIAFKEIVADAKWFDVKLVRSRKLTITNTSHSAMKQVTAIIAGARAGIVSRLGPGESATIEIPDHLTISADDLQGSPYVQRYGGEPTIQYSSLAQISNQTKEIVVKAEVEAPVVGPHVGQVVSDRQSILLAYFTGLHFGKETL